MNPVQLEGIRTRLIAERDSAFAEAKAHRKAAAGGADEVEEAIVGSDEKLIAKIDLALSQIADGTYGICQECRSEIPIGRLEAKPAVSLCAGCQENKERSART